MVVGMAAVATVAAVKALVFPGVFKRAQEIEASQKLSKVVFQGDEFREGSAECIGSSPSDVYELSFSIGEGSESATAGKCSCAASSNARSGLCKHVVALLLRRTREVLPEVPPRLHASEAEEEVISIISKQAQDARSGGEQAFMAEPSGMFVSNAKWKSVDGGIEATPWVPDPPASKAKRALPSWMLGPVASVQREPKDTVKSRKRAVAPKPPCPPKRVRRPEQPVRISSDFQGDEDPGEVEDAEPLEEHSFQIEVEDLGFVESSTHLSGGAAARERRRLRALQKEEIEDIPDIIEGKGVKRGRSRRNTSLAKPEVEDPPVRPNRQKRLVRKYIVEYGDQIEEAGPGDSADDDGVADSLGLREKDLFLTQEHVRPERKHAEDTGQNGRSEMLEPSELPPKQKKSSIFSMSNWKELSSQGGGVRGAWNLETNQFDLESMKNYSLGESSGSKLLPERLSLELQDEPQEVCPHFQTSPAAVESRDVSMSLAIPADSVDAVADDMLDIMFGSAFRGSTTAKNLPEASSTFRSPLQDNHNDNMIAVGLGAPLPSSLDVETSGFAPVTSLYGKRFDVEPGIPSAKMDLDNLTVQSKPKRKSSLKDKVKMFLT